MTYVLTGFFQDGGFRVFSYDGITADHRRSPFWVRADLALARQHKLPVQELPLLCRGVLDNRDAESEEHTLTFSRAEMARLATTREQATGARRFRRPMPKVNQA